MPQVEGVASPAILAGALALGLAVQFALPATTFPPTPIRASRNRPLEMAPPLAPIGSYSAILLRPLFSPGRLSGDTSAGETIAPVGAFALIGAASAGARASAVLRTSDGAVHALKLGEALKGWRLRSVGPQGAMLSHSGVSQSLRVGAPADIQALGVTPQAIIR